MRRERQELSSQDTWGVLGKKIGAAALMRNSDNGADTLTVRLEGGPTLLLWDDGQSCCEKRYMRTDDDLTYFLGATLTGIEVREGPRGGRGEEAHDIDFLVIHTDVGDITLSNHNEHNGYYAGFNVQAEVSHA